MHEKHFMRGLEETQGKIESPVFTQGEGGAPDRLLQINDFSTINQCQNQNHGQMRGQRRRKHQADYYAYQQTRKDIRFHH